MTQNSQTPAHAPGVICKIKSLDGLMMFDGQECVLLSIVPNAGYVLRFENPLAARIGFESGERCYGVCWNVMVFGYGSRCKSCTPSHDIVFLQQELIPRLGPPVDEVEMVRHEELRGGKWMTV